MRKTFAFLALAPILLFANDSQTPPPPQELDLFNKSKPAFIINGEFLYWTLSEGALDYAIRMKRPAVRNDQGFFSKWENHKPSISASLDFCKRKTLQTGLISEFVQDPVRHRHTNRTPQGRGKVRNGKPIDNRGHEPEQEDIYPKPKETKGKKVQRHRNHTQDWLNRKVDHGKEQRGNDGCPSSINRDAINQVRQNVIHH